tara:strand:+ start:3260 stop:3547 length:288 start_codon:yes stop_codon:yes gene_type:complete
MTPLNKDAFWDRRLKQSHDELQRIVKIGTKYKDDPETLRKKMKKEKKYQKSLLGELAKLDDSIYNVKKSPQESDVRGTGEEIQGTDSTDRESTQT